MTYETSSVVRVDERLPQRIARYQMDFSMYKVALWPQFTEQRHGTWRVLSRIFVQDEVSGKEEPVDGCCYVYATEDEALISAGMRIIEHYDANRKGNDDV